MATTMVEDGAMTYRIPLLAAVLVTPVIHAQHAPPRCGGLAWRDYQVEHQVRFIADSTLDIVPIDTVGNPRNLVQFVVDTLGRVIPESFEARRIVSEPEFERARTLLPQWRYTPATNGGRPTCQLVETYLKRSGAPVAKPSPGTP
jgi:hypothetical protein